MWLLWEKLLILFGGRNSTDPIFIFLLMPDACIKFAIDVGVEIVILFENSYEIYGDILGAKNCFGFEAYEQGEVWNCRGS